MNKLLSVIIITSMGLTACGGEHGSGVYKKQRTPTAIKIDKIDLSTHNLALRFNYRSYVEKTLENIQCDITIDKDININIEKTLAIQLGAFATEVLNFENTKISLKQPQDTTSFEYSLICHINYDQGQETIRESSVLHLVPGEKFIYR